MKLNRKKYKKIIKKLFFLLIILIAFFIICIQNNKKNEVYSQSDSIKFSNEIKESEVITFDSIDDYEELKETMQKFDDEIEKNNILNISECSEEFMEKYFEDMSKLNDDIYENIDNIEKSSDLNTLIVTAKAKLTENYGAVKVVEAPNNQYFLRYDSSEQTEKAYNNFCNSSEIISVDYDKIVKINLENDYQNYYNVQSNEYNSWGIESMGLDKLIPKCPTNKEIVVAIIDTGCNLDLLNRFYTGKVKETYNAVNGSLDVSDSVGHGTHIAGTIAEGTASNVKLLPIKVSDKASILDSDIIAALNYVIYNKNADVINMSFGSEAMGNKYVAFKSASEKNIICVAASGNDGKELDYYPAAFDNTISVGAYENENYERGYYSNYTSTLTFCAPGTNIYSINGRQSGTSMATPHVACAVAALKCFNKDISLNDVINCLRKYCFDLGPEGKDDWYGYGMINFNNLNICSCKCEKCKGIYCNECDCDNCVYENMEEQQLTKIEFLNLSKSDAKNYNFYSLSNLSYSKVKLYYGENNYEIKYLLDLDGAEIKGYNCDDSVNYITVKYKDFIIEGAVGGNIAGEKGWAYIDDNDGLKLTIFKDDKKYSSVKNLYIPDLIENNEVTSLENGLLKDRVNLKTVIIPNTIKNIGNEVFSGCNNLSKVSIPSSVISIGANAFENCNNLTLYVDSGSYAEEYAKKNNLKYVLNEFEIESIELISEDLHEYFVFDTVDISKIKIKVVTNKGNVVEITEGFDIKYENDRTGFKYGDTKYTIKYNKNGIEFELDVDVIVNKKIPEYTIPEGLKIIQNGKLEDLVLPEGFEWENPSQSVGEKGDKVFKAVYIPKNIENYEIVRDIDVVVEVYGKNINNIVENSLNVLLCKDIIEGKENIVINQFYNENTKSNITKAEVIKANSNISDIKNSDNNLLKDTDKVKTGDKAIIQDKEYTCIVYGDANGDGIICDIDDIMVVINDYLRKKVVDNEKRIAADLVGKDNRLDIDDVMKMIRIYLRSYRGGIYNIPMDKVM